MDEETGTRVADEEENIATDEGSRVVDEEENIATDERSRVVDEEENMVVNERSRVVDEEENMVVNERSRVVDEEVIDLMDSKVNSLADSKANSLADSKVNSKVNSLIDSKVNSLMDSKVNSLMDSSGNSGDTAAVGGKDEKLKIIVTAKKKETEEELLQIFESFGNAKDMVKQFKKDAEEKEFYSFVNSAEFMARKVLSLPDRMFIEGDLPIKLEQAASYKKSTRGQLLRAAPEQVYVELIGTLKSKWKIKYYNPIFFAPDGCPDFDVFFPRKEFLVPCTPPDLMKLLFKAPSVNQFFWPPAEEAVQISKLTESEPKCSVFQAAAVKQLGLKVACSNLHLLFYYFPMILYANYFEINTKDYVAIYTKEIFDHEKVIDKKNSNLEAERLDTLQRWLYFKITRKDKVYDGPVDLAVIKKHKNRFMYLLTDNSCEHLSQDMSKVDNLKLRNGIYYCEHDNPIFCEHLVEYQKLSTLEFNMGTLDAFFSNYRLLDDDNIYVCKYCGERLPDVTGEYSEEDFTMGTYFDVDEVEKKRLKKECRFAMANLTFNGIVSEKWKGQLASHVAKDIFGKIAAQKEKIAKYKNISTQHREAQYKITTYLYIYARLAKLVMGNSDKIRFREEHVNFRTKINAKQVFKFVSSLLKNILRNYIKEVEEFTTIDVDNLLSIVIEDFSAKKVSLEREHSEAEDSVIYKIALFYYGAKSIDSVKLKKEFTGSGELDVVDIRDDGHVDIREEQVNLSDIMSTIDQVNLTELTNLSELANLAEQVNLTEQSSPLEIVNPSERVDLTEQSRPLEIVNPSERVDLTEQTSPSERVNFGEQSSPSERVDLTEQVNTSDRVDLLRPNVAGRGENEVINLLKTTVAGGKDHKPHHVEKQTRDDYDFLIFTYQKPVLNVCRSVIKRKDFEFEIQVTYFPEYVKIQEILTTLRNQEAERFKKSDHSALYLSIYKFSLEPLVITTIDSINLKYGDKPKIHKHVWKDGLFGKKIKPLNQAELNEMADDYVCVFCGEQMAKQAKKPPGPILTNLIEDTSRRATLDYFREFCPENINHVFTKGSEVCQKCGYGTEKFLKTYHITIPVLDLNKPVKMEIIKEKSEKVGTVDAKYYSVGVNQKEYKNLWNFVGCYEAVEYTEILEGKQPAESKKIGRLTVWILFREMIVHLQKSINFEYFSFPDPGQNKAALKKLVEEVAEFYKKISDLDDYDYLRYHFVTFFNKIPKDTAAAFAQLIINLHKNGAKSDLQTRTSALVNSKSQAVAADADIDLEAEYHRGKNDFTYENFDYNGENSEI